MKKYNGHNSYNAWNVSLWVNNSEGIYGLALDCIKQAKRAGTGRDGAARLMLAQLTELGMTQTPDGVKYTVTNLRAAMVGM